jgi:hypothetical protein
MKPRKSTLFVALLALLLAAFAVGMGQGTTQTDQKKKAESCCAEGSSCCAEGMACKEGESCCKEGAECCKEGAECCKNHADKDHACCGGESCDMEKMKHDGKAKYDPKKHGNCCKMKDKNKTKTKTAA